MNSYQLGIASRGVQIKAVAASAGLMVGIVCSVPAALASGLTFTNYTTANGLVNNVVNGVYADSGSIYAATGAGLSISTNGGSNWTNYTTANGLVNNAVRGVYADATNIYAATSGGLSIAQLPAPNPVPAPLPVVGALAALSSCRRLRATSRRLRER